MIGLLLFYLFMVGASCRKSDHSFHLHDLGVECLKDGMSVTVQFQDPFRGIIYSKGHHEKPNCRYVALTNNGPSVYNFVIPKHDCGTSVQTERGNSETVMENIIIIQNDPDITEAWDTARRLRCIWRQSFAKVVTSRPFQVERPVTIPINFTQDAVNAVVQVQTGRGPFSAPASGYLHLGDESSLVVFIQDPTNRYDARMVDCQASGGSERSIVRLTDDKGCVTRSELMTPFYKTRDTRQTGANLIMYTHFRAFRLVDSPKFQINCNMQVCEQECVDLCRNKSHSLPVFSHKRRGFRLRRFSSDLSTNETKTGRANDLLRCNDSMDDVNATWILAALVFGATSVILLGVLFLVALKMRDLRIRVAKDERNLIE